MQYPIVIAPLPEEDGGGYLGCAPDLPGCISDGETQEEALKNTLDAIQDWIAECTRLGREIPEAGSAAKSAKARDLKLLEALESYENIDQKIDELRSEVIDLRENLESRNHWARFASLTGLPIVADEDDQSIKGHC